MLYLKDADVILEDKLENEMTLLFMDPPNSFLPIIMVLRQEDLSNSYIEFVQDLEDIEDRLYDMLITGMYNVTQASLQSLELLKSARGRVDDVNA